MKSIYISDRLHRRAKLRAAEQGIPLNKLVAELVEQGLLAQTAPLLRVGDAPTAYLTNALPIAGQSSTDERLDQLVRDGTLSSGQDSSRWLAQVCRSDEPVELLDAAQIRALFRQQRERHPDSPTSGELLRQMREDES
jgi:hypothetical protein